MTYSQIKAALRAGVEPDKLEGFRPIGRGSYRTAYGNGVFVVKYARGNYDYMSARRVREWTQERARDRKVKPPRIAPSPVVYGPSSEVGTPGERYMIQRQYVPLVPQSKEEITQWGRIEYSNRINQTERMMDPAQRATLKTTRDAHAGNYAQDKRGRLVCFDW